MLLPKHSQFQDLRKLIETYKPEAPVTITLQGLDGSGMHELMDDFLSKLARDRYFLQYFYPEFKNYTLAKIIKKHLKNGFKQNKPEIALFLNKFPPAIRFYLINIFNNEHTCENDLTAVYEDIYINFLTFIANRRKLILIFENVDQMSPTVFEVVKNFLIRLKHVPAIFLFSSNSGGRYKHYINADQKLIFSRPSVRETEKWVQEFFSTTLINARIITNHCYLKTRGNIFQIRFLLETVYRPLFEEKDVINLTRLQTTKIPGNQEAVYQLVFSRVDTPLQNTLVILSHLDEYIIEEDLSIILTNLGMPVNIISEWVNMGIIQKINREDRFYYIIGNQSWKIWLQQAKAVHDLTEQLLKLFFMKKNKNLTGVYQVSNLLYDAGEIEAAIESARNEADFYYEEENWNAAADRLYFLVRMSNLKKRQVSQLDKVFKKLSDVYVCLGIYQNAFEILRRLRDYYSRSLSKKITANHSNWLQTNLKMAEVLIKMDAFQEAKYIIREINVKRFCDLNTKGWCNRLLGEIEQNLAHSANALRYYNTALNFFKEDGNPKQLFSVYNKVKSLVMNDEEKEKLILYLTDYYEHLEDNAEYYAPILRDHIVILLKKKEYISALRKCYLLQRKLRQIYHIQLQFQTTLYFVEIYSRLGKWFLAISHIRILIKNNVISHRPYMLVHSYMQSGMLFKEQASYAKARSHLEEGLKLSNYHGFIREKYEIELHLGHLHILSHSYIKAHEYLKRVHHWAEVNTQPEILILTKLYLSYYELLHNRNNKSRKFLREAKSLINLGDYNIDFLNYLFYLSLWLMESGRPANAASVIKVLDQKAEDIPRYKIAASYLKAKSLSYQKKYKDADNHYGQALKLAKEWNLHQFEYLICCELAKLAIDAKEVSKKKSKIKAACVQIKKIANSLTDDIMRTQFLEARFHENILEHCYVKD